jgi:hypothetical protein
VAVQVLQPVITIRSLIVVMVVAFSRRVIALILVLDHPVSVTRKTTLRLTYKQLRKTQVTLKKIIGRARNYY